MQKVIAWIKSNPWLAGLGIVAFLLLVFFLNAGTGNAASDNATGKSDAEINADTQIQMAKIAAQASAAQLSLDSSKDQHNFEIQIASLKNDQLYNAAQLQSTEKISLAEIDANKQAVVAQAAIQAQSLASQEKIAAINANAAATAAQLNANAQVAAAKASKKKCILGFCW